MRGASFLLLLSTPIAVAQSSSSKISATTKGKLIARRGLFRRLRNRDDHTSAKSISNTLSNDSEIMSSHTVSDSSIKPIEESELMELMRCGDEYLQQRGLVYEEIPERPKVSTNSEADDTRVAIEDLIRARSLARASRNYAEADAIKEERRAAHDLQSRNLR